MTALLGVICGLIGLLFFLLGIVTINSRSLWTKQAENLRARGIALKPGKLPEALTNQMRWNEIRIFATGVVLIILATGLILQKLALKMFLVVICGWNGLSFSLSGIKLIAQSQNHNFWKTLQNKEEESLRELKIREIKSQKNAPIPRINWEAEANQMLWRGIRALVIGVVLIILAGRILQEL